MSRTMPTDPPPSTIGDPEPCDDFKPLFSVRYGHRPLTPTTTCLNCKWTYEAHDEEIPPGVLP